MAPKHWVRIRSEDGNIISPAEFIPLAEETGLIVPLGKVVLIKSCQQAALWKNAGSILPVSVNIAAAQFMDPGLMGLIEQLLMECQLSPDLLELEVTETALIQDPERTAEILKKFRALGIRIAIDDFGTGYSSLSYLKRFKVDVLKIDMSFVKDMLQDKSDYEIVKTIISLGQSMNIELIAEGIETAAHQASLQELGCLYGQGYYYSKPLPPEQFIQYLQVGKH
ncbi:putative bifunctional diguanylate cyclase/phosphodiesterase [Rheinheimera aquimaris]|uniref:putative bifunctional diguanylate cyclase/phosphodiesterase n=1 Tax=Rheinheimera aquimaris TaxID=412437 RepID=UPI002681C479